MTRFLGLVLVIILSSLSKNLNAQVSYVWQGYFATGVNQVDPSFYRMYKMDVSTGNKELWFSIDSSEFVHPDIDGLEQEIHSFEFNRDSTGIFFLETEGELFYYDILSADVSYILDVSPENSNILFHAYTEAYQIDRFNDSLFFIGGSTQGWFNSYTHTFELIRRPASHSAGFSEFESTIVKYDLIKYQDDWFFINKKREVRKTNLFDPESTELVQGIGLLDDSSLFDICMIEYQHACDSTSLLLAYKTNTLDSLAIQILDTNTGVISPFRKFPLLNNVDGFYYRILDIQHTNDPSWESCQRRIDLDGDDSTDVGLDYTLDSLCDFSSLPLCDSDIEISNEYPLDSIVLQITAPDTDLSIDIPSGNYSVLNTAAQYSIISNGSTSNEELLQALRASSLSYSGAANSMSISFTAWYAGTAGRAAIAHYYVYETIANAGDDVEREYCDADPSLSLDLLVLSNADEGGVFYSSSFDEIMTYPSYTAPARDTIYYRVGDEVCSDTATYINIIHPLPEVSPVLDTMLCYEDTWTLSISNTESILWEDNSESPIRTIDTEGIYSYQLRNIYGCKAYDTFAVQYSAAPTLSEMSRQICPGDSVMVFGRYYSEPGSYRDTIYNTMGCDSIRYGLGLTYYDEVPIVIDGPNEICEGEEAEVSVSSVHTALHWQDEELAFPVTIDQAGDYTISGTDENGCPQETTWSLTIHPNPEIQTEDMIDTIFSAGLDLIVDYVGDIETYSWSPSSALSCDDCAYPSLMTAVPGIYQVSVTDANGCMTRASLEISFASSTVYLPNIISAKPAQAINGSFFLQGKISGTYDMYIYDRWGSLVYEAQSIEINNSDEGWQPQEDILAGVYVYQIIFQDDTQTQMRVGDVTVVK